MHKLRRLSFLSLFCFVLLGNVSCIQEQDDPFANSDKQDRVGADKRMTVSASVDVPKARRGATITLKVKLDIAKGFHTYPLKQIPEADENTKIIVSKLELNLANVAAASGEATGPLAKKQTEKGVGTYGVYEDVVELEQKIIVLPDAKPGSYQLGVTIDTQVCDHSGCTPFNKTLQVPLTITDEPPVEGAKLPVEPARPMDGNGNGKSPASLHSPGKSKIDIGKLPDTYEAIRKRLIDTTQNQEESNDLMAFILSGIFWGFISLITPCVFPMIPITVSYFLKQSEQEHHNPLAMALVYTLTIVVVLTLAAVLLLETFQQLSQIAATNFVIGALFIFFALSLFGMYEIELPSGLSRFTSAREGQGGYAGTIFMAFTFTIISFSCVAPFLGGFAGTSAAAQARPLLHTVLGGLAFSATFAAPFFFLALFPGLLKKLPKSGNWLNSVKVVMGFLELAAALKFLRAGELRLMAGEPALFLTYDLVMALWIGISLAAAFYLFNAYRLPHDTPSESVGVVRMLFALLFVFLAVLMLPALFKVNAEGEKQRPDGSVFAWIDSFLLPEPKQAEWSNDLNQAIKDALDQRNSTGKRHLVFVDFTGIICTNCRYNEQNIFREKKITDLFKQYHLVQLVTDSGKGFGDITQQFQREAFGTAELPLYVILEPLPDGKIKVHGKVGGKINSVDSFEKFLKTPLGE